KAATKPQVVQAPAKPKADIVVSDKGTMPVPAETVEEHGEPGIETEADGGTEPVEQAVPVGPSYPGEDPTGEAMVASKRAMTYPKESMSSYSEGDVMVEVYVAASGTVMATNVLSGPDDIRLREMAVKTIARYWSFKPAERNYKVVIEVSFKMEPVAAAEPHFISATFID
ncbi:MAG TPA: TonB family protein, partial [Bacillota bacterium]|nr:TonB family protein [Bacillota bacterium]HOH10732.1 TonB family protein [Bacillota bacterium]